MQSQDKFVCIDCFENKGIRDFISNHYVRTECSFCDEFSDGDAVASLEQVAEHIKMCLFHEYDDAVDWTYIDSDTKEPMNVSFDAWEILERVGLQLPRDHDYRLFDALAHMLSDISWSERNLSGISHQDEIRFDWESFCEVVKHKRRYFFESYEDEFEYDAYSLGQILNKLFEYAEQYRLFKTVRSEQTLFRARFQEAGTTLTTAQDLGPPPLEFATQSNRMSPAGIPMFYASDDIETALRETADKDGTYTVGLFKTRRAMTILDLTQIPPIPSLFQTYPDSLKYRPREVLRFLNHIAAEISKPITRDANEHIEYVPTQVVTEFVRSQLTSENSRIDGIKYGSAAHNGHASYVIFATQNNLVIPEEDRRGTTSNQWLELSDVIQRPISPETILKWKDETNRLRSPTLPLFDATNVN